MPRLATFCPFCESVSHALRKGPRKDVLRAGQVLFDVENNMTEKDDDSDPPPAYEGGRESDFVIEEEGEENGEDGNVCDARNQAQRQCTPQLVQTFRSGVKQGAAISSIDRSKSATMSPSKSFSMQSNTDTLRRSLSKHSGDDTERRGESSRTSRHVERKDGAGSEDRVESCNGRREATPASTGLTRQYWLRPNDTLMSLCLRFRINAATLCKLNDLPLSTANTTPHLVHTRQFLLIPEGAITSALTGTGGNADDGLQSALDGPVAQSRKQKIQRARKEAQGRFRAIVTKNENLGKGKARAGYGGDVTLCDERAAKAYITLMEAELRCVDFGDGVQSSIDDEYDQGKDEVEELDAAVEASRRERFNIIVKQAVCRWEMDSDWERQQRALGIIPTEAIAANSSAVQSTATGSHNTWLKKLHSITSSSQKDGHRVGWAEKAR
ncbi:hypothetical protein CBS101457_001842 [Exobasidium rhododendri]|nr:hypothetical protein CBS101457_001842 [Exobasidium rhododendri]